MNCKQIYTNYKSLLIVILFLLLAFNLNVAFAQIEPEILSIEEGLIDAFSVTNVVTFIGVSFSIIFFFYNFFMFFISDARGEIYRKRLEIFVIIAVLLMIVWLFVALNRNFFGISVTEITYFNKENAGVNFLINKLEYL